MPSPEPLPDPQPATPVVASPVCSAVGCADTPLVQWQRRPTEAELATLVAATQAFRDRALAAADPQQPPVFGPLPTTTDTTVPVYACGPHAISRDLGALVHASDCTAPDPSLLPGCNCTPEPAPAPEPMHTGPRTLPDHWQ